MLYQTKLQVFSLRKSFNTHIDQKIKFSSLQNEFENGHPLFPQKKKKVNLIFISNVKNSQCLNWRFGDGLILISLSNGIELSSDYRHGSIHFTLIIPFGKARIHLQCLQPI